MKIISKEKREIESKKYKSAYLYQLDNNKNLLVIHEKSNKSIRFYFVNPIEKTTLFNPFLEIDGFDYQVLVNSFNKIASWHCIEKFIESKYFTSILIEKNLLY